MIILEDFEQGSGEWLKARAGVITASEFDKVITPKTMKPSTQVDAYIARLAAEWALGRPLTEEPTGWMVHGLMFEEEAVNYYEFATDTKTQKAPFVLLDEARMVGCSPDRMQVEIKCPAPQTQIRYLLDGCLPIEYRHQVQGSMYVTGCEWWDFLSYYPELPKLLIRVERDEKFIAALDECVQMAVAKLAAAKERLTQLGVTRA